MGTNKRYPHLPAQRGEERELREARKRGPLRTLDSLQLRLHAQPLTIVPEQMTIWGHAWLQFGDTNVRCVVQVKRWTADAVGVQVTIDRFERNADGTYSIAGSFSAKDLPASSMAKKLPAKTLPSASGTFAFDALPLKEMPKFGKGG